MEISLAAEKIGQIWGFPLTNSMLLSWIVTIMLIIIVLFATTQVKLVPQGVQNFFEAIVEFLFNGANDIIGDEEQTKKYFPLAATIFIFVIFNNWIGLFPGVGTIGFHELHESKEVFIPLLRSGNADLNTTIALSVTTIVAVQVFGIAAVGTFRHIGKFINFKSPIMFFVGILELIGEFARMVSFSFRLFGNIFAGEVLLIIVASLVPFIAPLPFFFLELFVGAVQALVFAMLALVFIKGAIAIEH